MRQILLNSGGAVVARVPRPIVERGAVLVRVQYSLISVGTEIAPLRSVGGAAPDSSAVERGIEYAALARHYVRASLRDPRKALNRVTKTARAQMGRVRPARPVPVTPVVAGGQLSWTLASADVTFSEKSGAVTLVTDATPTGYQIMSQPIGVPVGQVALVGLV